MNKVNKKQKVIKAKLAKLPIKNNQNYSKSNKKVSL